MLALLLSSAHAHMVGAPPAGAREVAILVCAPDDCGDRTFWIDHEPSFDHLPVVLVEVLLAANVGTVAQGDQLATDFAADLTHATDAISRSQWLEADSALDGAARALDRWKSTPENASLFTLWYLRGGVARAQGFSSAERNFSQAAAVAWNRQVVLPPSPAEWQPAYYDTLAELVKHPPGTLVLEASAGDPVYALDGVPLGKAPLRMQVFAGTHRLTARSATLDEDWRTTVNVQTGRTTTTRARFPTGSDPDWAAGLLSRAVDTHVMDREVGDLLSEWATRAEVRSVRLLRLDPTAPSTASGTAPAAVPTNGDFPGYTLTQVWFDPTLRRFSETAP